MSKNLRSRFFHVFVLSFCASLVSYAYGQELTPSEEKALKTTAKQFVARLTATHDLRPLTREFFTSNFEPLPNAETDFVPTEMFAKLSRSERRRVFFAFWNYLYAHTVITQSKPKNLECYDESDECKKKHRMALLRVLTPATVDKIDTRENAPDEKTASTKEELYADVKLLESVFSEAYPILKAKRLERTKEFLYWINLFEHDRNLNYLIKPGIAENTYRDRAGRALVKKGEGIYGVETPLLIRVDFVKRGKRFKVFNLGVGDGD